MDIGPNFFLEVLTLGIYSNDEDTKLILKDAIELFHVDLAENPVMDDDISRFYMSLLHDIVYDELDMTNEGEVATILLKFKQSPVVFKDGSILIDIKKIIENGSKVSHRRINLLKKKVETWITQTKSSKLMRKIFGKSQQISSSIDDQKHELLLSEMKDLTTELGQVQSSRHTHESSTIDHIDMTCPTSVARGLSQHQDKREKPGLRTGLIGLNNMFGKQKAMAVGEFGAFAALSHHFKSGMLISWARWCCMLNKPPVGEDGIPTIVFISLENEAHENLMMWFREAYVNTFRESCDDMSNSDIITYVTTEFAREGFKLLVYRKMGQSFGYEEWEAMHDKLRGDGHYIVGSILDYITLMKQDLHNFGNQADALQGLVGKIKNYCGHHAMMGLTGLQLNGAAMEIASSGVVNVVKRFNEGHLAGAKGIKRELDLLWFLHIEKNHLGVAYLTCVLDKHKYVSGTPMEDKYAAWRFTKFGILDDVNGEDSCTKNIYDDGGSDTVENSTNKEGELTLF